MINWEELTEEDIDEIIESEYLYFGVELKSGTTIKFQVKPENVWVVKTKGE